MSAGHTPGPWAFRELRGDDGLGYITADERDIIHAGVGDLSADENRANARLIAAAPELLEALEGLVRYVDAVRRTMPLLKTQQARFDAAQAAIAKAKGGDA